MAGNSDLAKKIGTGTIRLQNNSDGKGDFIAEWNHPSLSKPTQSQLDSA